MWLAIALLVVPSFFFHVLLHELAHGLMARSFGCRVTFTPYPHKIDSRWVFGSTSIEGALTESESAFVTIAPVVVSLLWLGLVLCLEYGLRSQGIIVGDWPRALLIVEMVAPLVDLGTVLAGTIRRRPGTDGAKVLAFYGWPLTTLLWAVVVTLAARVGCVLWLMLG